MARKEKADDHSTKGAAAIGINQPYPLDRDSYTLVEEIGRGASSVVHKALCLPMESSVVAIKVIALQNPKPDLENVRREEAKIATLSDHPNILRAHCSFTVDDDDDNKSLWVVMPFMSGGSLQSIVAWEYPLAEACIAAVLKEILTAVCHLHGEGIPHRDIKTSNILVDSDGSVKLSDLGISASVYDSSGTGSRPYWMAPEVNVNAFRGDIWSFGITALELARGGPPLSNAHLPPTKASSLIMEVTKIIQSFKDMAGAKSMVMMIMKMTECFKHMVGLCLNRDPSKRPTPKILLMHSFFKNCGKLREDDVDHDRFLILNVLHGAPAVEQRLKGGEEIDRVARAGEILKNKRIRGWKLNDSGWELDPVYDQEESSSEYQKQSLEETSREEQLMQVTVNLEMEVGNQKTKWYEFDTENLKNVNWVEVEMGENQKISNWAEADKELEKMQLQLS